MKTRCAEHLIRNSSDGVVGSQLLLSLWKCSCDSRIGRKFKPRFHNFRSRSSRRARNTGEETGPRLFLVKTSEKFFVSYVSLIFVMARTFTAVFIDNGKKRFFVFANAFNIKLNLIKNVRICNKMSIIMDNH